MPITTTPSGGPVGEYSTYTPIYSTTITSGTPTSITLSNIPTTYTDLVLVASFAGYYASNDRSQLGVRLNGDSGTNYSYTYVRGNGTAATSGRDGSTITQFSVATFPLGPSSSLQKNSIIMQFMNYSNNSTYKTILARTSAVNSDNNTPYTDAQVLLWRNTAPITTITLKDLGELYYFYPGTNITLYGIKAAAAAPKATGGDVVYTDNTYWYHVFNNSGIFDVKTAMNVDYLVVAGGGGAGGGGPSGGGGGGGFLTSTGLSVTAQAYAITVGAGGSGGIVSGAQGTNGNNSVFSSVTATGGGKGGGYSNSEATTGANGGSGGGGAGGSSNAGGSASPSGQGNAGGAGITGSSNNRPAGGGGGAGAAGASASGNNGGNGGNGLANSYSGTSVTYAGGGGGGAGTLSTAAGTGGTGGGGNGSKSGSGSAGTVNLGGGGGGAENSGSGGNGGSGIVIVRYSV